MSARADSAEESTKEGHLAGTADVPARDVAWNRKRVAVQIKNSNRVE